MGTAGCFFVVLLPFCPFPLKFSPNSEKTDLNGADKNSPAVVSQHLSFQSLASPFLLTRLVLSCQSELSGATNTSQRLGEEFLPVTFALMSREKMNRWL